MSTALDAGEGSARANRRTGPIDLDHLGRQALGDPGLADEVLRLFGKMSRVYMDRVEASADEPSLIAHLRILKSAASGVGAWCVRDLARIAEDELRLGLPLNPERLNDLAIAVEECRAFIAGLLPDGRG